MASLQNAMFLYNFLGTKSLSSQRVAIGGKLSRVRGTAVAYMLSSTKKSFRIEVIFMKDRVRTLVYLIDLSSKIYFTPASTYLGREILVVGVRDNNVRWDSRGYVAHKRGKMCVWRMSATSPQTNARAKYYVKVWRNVENMSNETQVLRVMYESRPWNRCPVKAWRKLLILVGGQLFLCAYFRVYMCK